jgi:hypothetical protein
MESKMTNRSKVQLTLTLNLVKMAISKVQLSKGRRTPDFSRTSRMRMKLFFRNMKMKLLYDKRRLKKVRLFRRD